MKEKQLLDHKRHCKLSKETSEATGTVCMADKTNI